MEIYIAKGALKTYIPEFVLFNLVLTVKRPYKVVVMVVSLKEKLEIEMANGISMGGKELLHGRSCIALQIPQCAVEIEKEVLVWFQNDMPICFMP